MKFFAVFCKKNEKNNRVILIRVNLISITLTFRLRKFRKLDFSQPNEALIYSIENSDADANQRFDTSEKSASVLH